MARTVVAASAQFASFAVRQPRVAIGGAGLGGLVLIELVVTMLASSPLG